MSISTGILRSDTAFYSPGGVVLSISEHFFREGVQLRGIESCTLSIHMHKL